ncbi:MbnP family protein [Winogradskyella sp. Asnod2-B02-A]|uniref:MbnP family protein n=1 Tax=Winogradskyella sp. Asnod2-B02-A TaxID=3160583 RepID=UPI00386C9B3D
MIIVNMNNKQRKFKRQYVLLFLFLCAMLSSFSQERITDLKISIETTFNGEALKKEQWYVTKTKDSIQLSKLKFYLTDFVIQTENKIKDSIANSNFLIDAFDGDTTVIKLTDVNFNEEDKLLISIGVNENLNTSGANSGDLDPSKGMFWSWQSGYINFKVEGISPSCKTRKNKFQFHIGGFQTPYETIRPLIFKLDTVKNGILKINLDVAQFFDSIQLNSENQIMIPGQEASNTADKLPKLFSTHE